MKDSPSLLFAFACRLLVSAGFLLCLGLSGCMTEQEWNSFWGKGRKGAQPEPIPRTMPNTDAVRGTISPLVTMDGLRLMQVRGFGLVVDLVDTGGGDGPEVVKNYLIKEMRRRQQPGEPGGPTTEILDSDDASLVEVTGLIPAGAKKGDRFDVVLRALGTKTKALVGGRLAFCDLKLYAETPGGVIEGKTLATASGPIFVSPFDKTGLPTNDVDLRTGWVLGGGIVTEPRKVRLVLDDPSYSVAQQIVARLNGRYAKGSPVAVGQSPSFVDLNIPKDSHARKRLFLERVVHTTLNSSETFLKERAKDLAAEIVQQDAQSESIGLAWEAIGPICFPTLRELYLHDLPQVNYYAGRAGLRLSDRQAVPVVAKHARDPSSPFRDEAIDELGFATDLYAAGEELRKLLNDQDVGVRIRAYQALRKRPHPAIQSEILYEDNLILDVVDSTGSFLIFVQRSMEPRIALFGKQMTCRSPAIFPGERRDGRRLQAQITDKGGGDSLLLVFKNKRTGQSSPPMPAPSNVAELVRFLGGTPTRDENGNIQGLGAAYSEIVDILSWFCDSGSIPAKFVVEDLTGEAAYGEEVERERPESEY